MVINLQQRHEINLNVTASSNPSQRHRVV